MTILLAPNFGQAAPRTITDLIKADLLHRQNLSFETLAQNWERQYGTRAFQPLTTIATDPKNQDSDRYVAMMSAVKLGGQSASSMLLGSLRDPSWMIRSGALRGLSALDNPATGRDVLPLLHDSALVVRVEAVEAIKILKPAGATAALLSAIEDPVNYHGGKAQWVPQRALGALADLKSTESAPYLLALLNQPRHQGDSEFLFYTISALERLKGQNFKPSAALLEKIKAWKKNRQPK
jgi:HEAT repeat protein